VGRGRKERGEKKGKGELWARREEEGEVRWESTRDSFYISCRTTNFGNRRLNPKGGRYRGFRGKEPGYKRVIISTNP